VMVMGFTSHQQIHGVGLQIALLGAPTSLASIAVIGPHHAAVTHVSEVAPEWASRSTWFGWVFTGGAGLSFYVLVAISPRRARQVPAKWGGRLGNSMPNSVPTIERH
jgi:hypothetical protein